MVQPLKCENCFSRPRFEDRKWCRQCIKAYHNKDSVVKDIRATIPKLYQKAKIKDLSSGLREMFLLLGESEGVLFWGLPGRGKTYAMMAYALGHIVQGFHIKCVNYDLFCSRIRSSYQTGATETEHDIIMDLVGYDKLYIDDVGVTVTGGKQETDFSLKVFLTIIDQRMQRMKPTYITTNKPLEGIEASFDKRVSSRLKQCCRIVQITGNDRRVKQA